MTQQHKPSDMDECWGFVERHQMTVTEEARKRIVVLEKDLEAIRKKSEDGEPQAENHIESLAAALQASVEILLVTQRQLFELQAEIKSAKADKLNAEAASKDVEARLSDTEETLRLAKQAEELAKQQLVDVQTELEAVRCAKLQTDKAMNELQVRLEELERAQSETRQLFAEVEKLHMSEIDSMEAQLDEAITSRKSADRHVMELGKAIEILNGKAEDRIRELEQRLHLIEQAEAKPHLEISKSTSSDFDELVTNRGNHQSDSQGFEMEPPEPVAVFHDFGNLILELECQSEETKSVRNQDELGQSAMVPCQNNATQDLIILEPVVENKPPVPPSTRRQLQQSATLHAEGSTYRQNMDQLELEVKTYSKEMQNLSIVFADGMKAGSALFLAARRGDDEKTEQILERHQKPGIRLTEMRDENGYTALMLAALHGHTTTAALLLNAGANLETRNSNGCTALILAADRGRIDIVRLLLLYGADSTAKDAKGYTALLRAVYHGRAKTAAFLLSKFSDYATTADECSLALKIARRRGHNEIVQQLVSCGIKV